MGYSVIAALALVLVLEGLLPFLAPNLWRKMVIMTANKSDRTLRIIGLVLMLLGTGILFIMHRYF